MIERLPPASWETTLGGRFAPCAGGRRLPLRPLGPDAFEDVADEHEFLPAPLGRGWDGRFYWWYQGAVVRGYTSLDPEVVAAKLNALDRDRRNRSSAIRTRAARALVERRDEGACADCGSAENVHVSMIVPPSQGGTMALENLLLRCASCASAAAASEPAPLRQVG